MAELRLNTEEKVENEQLRLTNDTVITHDVTEEFSLPDYVPEIRRLLHVRAQALPESRYLVEKGTVSDLELGGTVTYLVIYTDDEGEIRALPLSSSYEAKTTLAAYPEILLIDTVVDNTAPRVTAPRRITVKCRLKSKILGWESVNEEEKIEGKTTADEIFIERKTESINALSLMQIGMQGIKVSDKLDMTGGSPVPVWCDANMQVNDVRVERGTVSVRGDIGVKCICKDGDETVVLTKKLPLAEEIEATGATASDLARVSGRCVSLAVSNEQSEASSQLFFDLVFELEGEVIRGTEVELTRDCYSTRCETEEEYKTIDVYSAPKAENICFTINEGIKRKSREINEIIDITWDPVYEKAEFKNGKAILSGKLKMAVIGLSAENGEGEREYLSEEYELPFKYAAETGATKGELMCRCIPTVGEAEGVLDGEKLAVSAQMHLSYEIFEKTKAQILSKSTLKKDRTIKKEAGSVRVYFPKEGDTLWEIAKKYHTTVTALKEKNSLSGDAVESIKSIII